MKKKRLILVWIMYPFAVLSRFENWLGNLLTDVDDYWNEDD